MGRRRVEVVINLLYIFTMVALAVCEAEQSLFQNWIFPIPDRKSQADALMLIAETEKTVLAPAIGATARMIVCKIIPGRSIRTVIFAHGSPLALAEIRAPAPPMRLPIVCFFQSFALFHKYRIQNTEV